MSLWDIIVWPFARLLEILYNGTHNYGVAIILFALLVNVILFPFMAKSKKSMMRTSRIQPQLKELERKCAGNQQRYQIEVQKLYKEMGVNPMSGCLWSLLPFPILIALYGVIRQPLARMMGLSAENVEQITAWATKMQATLRKAAAHMAKSGYELHSPALERCNQFSGRFRRQAV